jgi:nicotinate-nucleotide adenylyltransferase
MTELAIAGEPGFEISLADAPSPAGQPNYTLETLRSLHAGLPPGGCLFCLMGADSFRSLRKWRGAAEVPFAASLIVASRPGEHINDLTLCLPPGITLVPNGDPVMVAVSGVELRAYTMRNSMGNKAHFYVLPGLDILISASDIRAQIRSSEDSAIPPSLAPTVADYIRTHGLYR